MDLGVKDKDLASVSPVKADKEKVHYPSFDVRDEKADDIREEHECKVGTPFEAKIKGQVVGDSKDKFSNRVTFELQSMDITSYGGKESKDEDAGEEKTLGYKRPKTEKETPDTSAKSMY